MQRTVEEYLPKLFQPYIMCAGNQATKQGSCSGDSGGPLMVYSTKSNQYEQVGIVAGGINPNCEKSNFPGVYTRLDHPEILEFIQQILVQPGRSIVIIFLKQWKTFSDHFVNYDGVGL